MLLLDICGFFRNDLAIDITVIFLFVFVVFACNQFLYLYLWFVFICRSLYVWTLYDVIFKAWYHRVCVRRVHGCSSIQLLAYRTISASAERLAILCFSIFVMRMNGLYYCRGFSFFLGQVIREKKHLWNIGLFCDEWRHRIFIWYFQLRMHAYLCWVWFIFVLWCEFVSPCYQRWCNNLNEPLDPFPFLGGCWIKRWPGLRLLAFL